MEGEREKVVFKWNHDLISYFLNEIRENWERLQTGVKKVVFMEIAEKIRYEKNADVNWEQCENKWKGLVRQYNTINEHNRLSGNKVRLWIYHDDINEILNKTLDMDMTPVDTHTTTYSETEEIENVAESLENEVDLEEVRSRPINWNRNTKRTKIEYEEQVNIEHVPEQIENKVDLEEVRSRPLNWNRNARRTKIGHDEQLNIEHVPEENENEVDLEEVRSRPLNLNRNAKRTKIEHEEQVNIEHVPGMTVQQYRKEKLKLMRRYTVAMEKLVAFITENNTIIC